TRRWVEASPRCSTPIKACSSRRRRSRGGCCRRGWRGGRVGGGGGGGNGVWGGACGGVWIEKSLSTRGREGGAVRQRGGGGCSRGSRGWGVTFRSTTRSAPTGRWTTARRRRGIVRFPRHSSGVRGRGRKAPPGAWAQGEAPSARRRPGDPWVVGSPAEPTAVS